jgi:hypothetical protein
VLYIRLATKARRLGYALAPHGSMARDIDLIAVPWTEDAVSGSELVRVIAEMCNGYLAERTSAGGRPKPTVKPHGRRAWSIHLGGGAYIDLSVMPRRKSSTQHV